MDRKPTARRSKPSADESLREMIATAAYFRAESRGFGPGSELDDWLQAEAEIKARLTLRSGARKRTAAKG
jgi:hypothetical protein